ncbi:hypothetical protein [Kaarinaea lacus]
MRTIQKLLTLVIVFLAANIAYAEQVTFQIKAVVDHIYDPDNAMADRIKLGESLTSTYTFDTTIPDTASSPIYGFYNQANNKSNGFSLIIKKLSATPITSRNIDFHSINTWNSHGDFYYAESKMRSPVGNGITITYVGLEIFDITGQAIPDDKLTNIPPNISFARDKNLLISGRSDNAGEDFEIRAKIYSIVNAGRANTIASQDF